MNKKGRIMK